MNDIPQKDIEAAYRAITGNEPNPNLAIRPDEQMRRVALALDAARQEGRQEAVKMLRAKIDETPNAGGGAGIRVGLAIGVKLIERGRLLTAREQLNNLSKALAEPDDAPPSRPQP